jgi:CubicO group peptidase (beta-lactamase class C family)
MSLSRVSTGMATLVLPLIMMGCGRAPAQAGGAVQTASPPPSLAPPPPDRSAFLASVDALAAEALQKGPIAGLSIAVVERGTPVLVKGYGLADQEAAVPATAKTSYPIASVSKHVTAALVLRLADQGKLALDDPLRRFFPNAPQAIGVLTLRHLLQHTSGLTRGGPAPYAATQSVLRRGGTARGQGEDWDYSNYNFSLLGLVIEQVSGRTYAEYLRDEVAVPLGLTGTAYCEDGSAVPGRGQDYQSGLRSVTPTPYWTQAKFFAAGGLCSTVEDLVAFEKALEDGRVISPAMLRAMRTPARLADGLEADYGLGTRLGVIGGHAKLGHTGGGQSNRAVLARYPEDDVTIAVLLNTERKDARVTALDIEEGVTRLFFRLPEVPSAMAVPQDELRRCAGRYRDGPRLIDVSAANGSLVRRSTALGKGPAPLIPQGGHVFVDEKDPSIQLRFQMGGDAARGYGRYHNGWFVGLGVRADD